MNKIIKNLIDKSDIVVRDEKTGEIERFSVTPKDIKEILNDKEIVREAVHKANEEQRKIVEDTNLKQFIEKELEEFDRQLVLDVEDASNGKHSEQVAIIKRVSEIIMPTIKRDASIFLKQALKRIAQKTAKALEVERIDVKYGTDELEQQYWDRGYNQAVQKFKENKDKYLK